MRTIKVQTDNSCQMACVWLDEKCVHEGNLWDFYDGCHGDRTYGEFNSLEELVRNIQTILVKSGEEVKIVREKYKYE